MSHDDEPGRQAGRRDRRQAGDRSARLAKILMDLPGSAIDQLGLEQELRAAVDRARAVTSKIARRRAERGLSGDLRRADLGDLRTRLAGVQAASAVGPQLFKLAESWRARLIEEGEPAAADFPGGANAELLTLVQQARRERDTGRPRGATRALFRHVFAALAAAPPAPARAAEESDS